MSAHNPGYLADQPYQAGSVIEFYAYDDKPAAQGRVLASVEDTIDRDGDGCWLSIQVRCVEDEHLVWWLGEGPGAKFKGKFQLHLCHEVVTKCKRITKKDISQFHTDTLRTISLLDIKNRVAAWWLVDPAKGDFESFRAACVKESAKKATAGPVRDPLEFDPSEDDFGEDRGQAGLSALDGPRTLAEKLASLKRETEPAVHGKKRRRGDRIERIKARSLRSARLRFGREAKENQRLESQNTHG